MCRTCITIAKCITVAPVLEAGGVIENIGTVGTNTHNDHAGFQVTFSLTNGILVGVFVAFTIINSNANAVFSAQQMVDPVAAEKLGAGEGVRFVALFFFTLFETGSTGTSVVSGNETAYVAVELAFGCH